MPSLALSSRRSYLVLEICITVGTVLSIRLHINVIACSQSAVLEFSVYILTPLEPTTGMNRPLVVGVFMCVGAFIC